MKETKNTNVVRLYCKYKRHSKLTTLSVYRIVKNCSNLGKEQEKHLVYNFLDLNIVVFIFLLKLHSDMA